MSNPVHFRAAYHLPRWQGGDAFRPLCRREPGWDGLGRLSAIEGRVTCADCLTRLANPPAPTPQLPRRRRTYVPTPRPPRVPDYVWTGPTSPPPPPTLGDIAREVARRHRLTVEDLISTNLLRSVVKARQEAMWRAYQTGRFSTTKIGRYFGGRDHTTVLHALRRVNDLAAEGKVAA